MSSGVEDFIKRKLVELEKIILRLHPKTKQLYVDWLPLQNKFLREEKAYDYSKHLVYKRRMVVPVELGFGVGSEHGGFHWAAIIQNDNKSARTVVIVPLSSLKEGQTTHYKDAYLGKIANLNENEVEALVGQITTISKMRIVLGRQIHYLTEEQLDKIDEKIIERYVSPVLREKLVKTTIAKTATKPIAKPIGKSPK